MNQPVVCLGILVADVIGRPIDSYPEPGALSLVDSITPHIGGCAATTGIGLQTLGIETTVVGKVGRDGFGDFVRAELEKRGVQARVSTDESAPTSATMAMVRSDAERAFLHCTGANATFGSEDIDPWLLDGCSLLHIAGHGLMPRFDGAQCAQLLAEAKRRGVKTSLDTAGAPNEAWTRSLRQCLPHLDFFVPSLHEAQYLFPGESSPQVLARRIVDAGVGVVALKMGERGSLAFDGQQEHLLPAFRVEAIDATGAGDAFAAGLLCGALNALPLEECARLGNAVGALCTTQVGTIAGYRSLPKTLDFISQHQIV
jgi:sugar/nucleoside kinase (ribokinase family)